MSVYVDSPRFHPRSGNPYPDRRWSHLVADSPDELHEFARCLGLKRGWFQDHPRMPHYDITEPRYERAIRLGAIPVTSRDLVRLMVAR